MIIVLYLRDMTFKIEIAFPLNSKVILIMSERQHFQAFANQNNNLFSLTLRDIEHYNRLQIYNCTRFIFCSLDCFDLVKIVCQKQPKI